MKKFILFCRLKKRNAIKNEFNFRISFDAMNVVILCILFTCSLSRQFLLLFKAENRTWDPIYSDTQKANHAEITQMVQKIGTTKYTLHMLERSHENFVFGSEISYRVELLWVFFLYFFSGNTKTSSILSFFWRYSEWLFELGVNISCDNFV